MIIYVKNPEVAIEAFGCCGIRFDDDTAVFGDKFSPFTDPNTFPGKLPKLKMVKFDELTQAQRDCFEHFRTNHVPPPPRHLGLITTNNFETHPDGTEFKISSSVLAHEAPVPKPEVDDPEEIERIGEEKEEAPLSPKEELLEEQESFVDDDPGSDVIKLSDYTSGELVALFPGVTMNNVGDLMEAVDTMEDLINASNAILRDAGIRTNYFVRIREMAVALLEEVEAGGDSEDDEKEV